MNIPASEMRKIEAFAKKQEKERAKAVAAAEKAARPKAKRGPKPKPKPDPPASDKPKRAPAKKYASREESYAANKAAAAEASALRSAAGRELGDLPKVVDPARREACRLDLLLFIQTYLGSLFPLPFSDDHLEAIAIMQSTILNGGRFALAMPRGNGKSTLAKAASIWALFYGHCPYLIVVAANAKAAKKIVKQIMHFIETFALLKSDFPEIVVPIRALDGANQRTSGQTYKGQRTRIAWSESDVISFPCIPGSPASAAGLASIGLNGAIRGETKAGADGNILRPRMVLIDDPSDDRSARVKNQNDTREAMIEQSLAMLCGPGETMSMLMACTIIEDDDVASRFLDKERHPDWDSRTFGILKSMPSESAMAHWKKYRELRKASLKQYATIDLATQYYQANHKAMNDGALPAWEQRIDPGMVDAVQSAMDVWAKNERAFWCELMNAPQRLKITSRLEPESKYLLRRVSSVPRFIIPDWATRLTAAIDVQGTTLWFLVAAFSDDMRPHIIDFGIYPDQKKPYITKSHLNYSLQDVTNAATETEALTIGLNDLAKSLLNTQYVKQDGTTRTIDLIAIDGNWEQSTNTVYQVARQIGNGRILPIHGRARTAKQSPIDSFRAEPTARRGPGWLSERGHRQQLHLVTDTNFIKSWLYQQMTATDGGLSLFDGEPSTLTLLADHLSSEFGRPITDVGTNRTVVEWSLRVGRDNEFLDCMGYASVAASYCGGLLPGQTVKEQKQRVSWAAQQRAKRGQV